jgi:aminoglycoside/choline kinase family phosphotransferase
MIRREAAEWIAAIVPGAEVVPFVGDASTRTFHRVHRPGGETAVLMDYGAPYEGETDDVALNRIFEDAGLPVPRILDASPAAGCLLVEDLGDLTLEQAVVAGGERVPSLLRSAVDLAAAIAVRGTPALARSARAAGPRLDAARFRFEMGFFCDNYAAAFRGIAPSSELRSALHALADRAAEGPPVLCHRDYHSRNLMVVEAGPQRDPHRPVVEFRLAMVDIQDARWGPDTYDLASLVRDPYVDLGDDEPRVEALVDRFLLARGAAPAPGFHERLHVVEAQRMIKCLGTYGHQVAVRGRERYAASIPPTLRRLHARLPVAGSTAPLHDLLVSHGLL